MIRSGIFAFALALGCAAAAFMSGAPARAGETGEREAAPIIIGETLKLESQILGDAREINVWLPRGYAESDDRRLYLTIANDGGTMQASMNRLVAALETGAPDGLVRTFVDRSASETHAAIYHGAALDALRWLYAKPPYDYGPTPWFMTENGEPPAEADAE